MSSYGTPYGTPAPGFAPMPPSNYPGSLMPMSSSYPNAPMMQQQPYIQQQQPMMMQQAPVGYGQQQPYMQPGAMVIPSQHQHHHHRHGSYPYTGSVGSTVPIGYGTQYGTTAQYPPNIGYGVGGGSPMLGGQMQMQAPYVGSSYGVPGQYPGGYAQQVIPNGQGNTTVLVVPRPSRSHSRHRRHHKHRSITPEVC